MDEAAYKTKLEGLSDDELLLEVEQQVDKAKSKLDAKQRVRLCFAEAERRQQPDLSVAILSKVGPNFRFQLPEQVA